VESLFTEENKINQRSILYEKLVAVSGRNIRKEVKRSKQKRFIKTFKEVNGGVVF
jgi:hypothetical protein